MFVRTCSNKGELNIRLHCGGGRNNAILHQTQDELRTQKDQPTTMISSLTCQLVAVIWFFLRARAISSDGLLSPKQRIEDIFGKLDSYKED